MKKTSFSLWHLAVVLLMSWVGISQAYADELTVFDGENVNTETPYYAEWGDSPQKHEFIMPASELAAMKDGKITSMQFYCTSEKSTPSFELKIFMKEVDQTSLTTFIGDEDATTVYEGTLTIADSKWSIELSTPYEYKGGNLLIGVYTTKVGNYTYLGFYGLKQELFTALSGISYSGTDYTSVNNVTGSFQFLPKTTFTYEAGTGGGEDVNPVEDKDLTICDGTDTDGGRTPYDANWGDQYQKHEFIIPADKLADMKDLDIKNMTFYAGAENNNPGAEVMVFLKEVDQTTLTNFIGKEGATTVYTGEVSVADSKWNIPFSTNYTYNGGNLLVGVYTTKVGAYTYCDYYGENQGDNVTAIYGRNETDLNSVAVKYTMKFIPKTTFTYGAAGSGGGGGGEEVIPEGTLLDNVLALKNFEFTDPIAITEDVVLKLTDVKVTYVNTESDFVVIEDESAGYAAELTGLSTLVSAGQTLNGYLAMTITSGWMGNEITLKNGIEGVTATDGEVTPFVVTEENATTFANDYDWRLAEVANVKINVTTGQNGDEISASIAQLGDMTLPINDRFNAISATVEDGMVGTLTGFVFSAYGMTICTPISFVENPQVRELENIKALKEFEFTDPLASSEDVVLKLTDAKVTYVNTESDFVVIEDESAGYAAEYTGLSNLVSAGQTLNGNLAMTITSGWMGNEITLKNGIEGVTATDGEVTPFVVTEENATTFANDYDWRLAEVANVKINVTTGQNGDEISASIAQLGDMTLPINDRFNAISATVEDGMVGTLTGFVFSAYGMTICTPVSFIENPKRVEIENLKALKEFTLEEGVEEVKAVLTLKDVKVTYVADNYDAVVVEDESTGYNFEYAGLSELLTAGQVLNGTFDITIAPFWFGTINVTVENGLDNVETTTAEVTPIVVTEENISTYMNDYDWRYAEIANVTINVGKDNYGKYFALSNELLGDNSIWISNSFNQFDETVEDGTTGTITGYLFFAYDSLWFTPLSFEADVTSINNVENNMMNNGAIYNMNGQRLSAPVRGINIINGKKVVVK